MYNFILNQWILRKYDEARVNTCVTKNYITQEQANAILAIQQIPAEITENPEV